MRLIIDFSDKYYEFIKNLPDDYADYMTLPILYSTIKNGVVLEPESMFSVYCSRCANFTTCKSTLPEGHESYKAYDCCNFKEVEKYD